MAGLYLHIPFCRRKCSYCDFYSFAASAEELREYPALLLRHLDLLAGQSKSLQIETIFFGGGTPSLLDPAAIGQILDRVHRLLAIAPDAEISLEANPGAISPTQLAGYRSAGVNRLSLGLQSSSDTQLSTLGRLHNHRDSLDAIDQARQAGFDNLSLDLMFALPGQTLTELEDEVKRFLATSPEHLSCYGLTAEPGTPLHDRVSAQQVTLPDDEFYATAYLLLHEQLSAAGYGHYEIANYARSGYECRHNVGYWQRTPYLALGAGGHSFYSDGWGSRRQVANDLPAYREALFSGRDPSTLLETFDRDSALKETVYLALRTRRGICDKDLQQGYGCTLEEAFPEALAACRQWLQYRQGCWAFTPHGWLLYDRLIQHFL